MVVKELIQLWSGTNSQFIAENGHNYANTMSLIKKPGSKWISVWGSWNLR